MAPERAPKLNGRGQVRFLIVRLASERALELDGRDQVRWGEVVRLVSETPPELNERGQIRPLAVRLESEWPPGLIPVGSEKGKVR